MRILITGASGYVGRFLLDRAQHLELGEIFPTVGGNPFAHRPNQPVAVDLTQLDQLTRYVEAVKPTHVWHLASLTDVAKAEAEPTESHRQIVDATHNLLSACAPFQPHLTYISSDMVFAGDQGNYRPSDDAQPTNVYGQHKREAEQLVLERGNSCVVRSALIFGGNDFGKDSFVQKWDQQLRAGKPLSLFTDEYRTPVYVIDLCLAIIRLSQQHATGIWHAGGPSKLTRWQMGELLARKRGLPIELLQPVTLSGNQKFAYRPRDASLHSDATWQTCQHQPMSYEYFIEHGAT